MADKLSLLELETFDASAPQRDKNRRFLCPFPGECEGKPRDAAHRSLGVNLDTGLWQCNRCKRSGKLTDYWTCRTCGQQTYDGQQWTCSCKGMAKNGLKKLNKTEIAYKKETTPIGVKPDDELWRRWWQASCQLTGTPGSLYLQKRGIPVELAEAAGVRFSRDWYGWKNAPGEAVLFPVRDEAGQLVAIDARFTDSERKQAAGDKRLGVFATAGAFQAPVLAITEAPIDALSLNAAGVPAIALCGTSCPAWLVKVAMSKPCLIGLDSDVGGDTGADKLQAELSRYSATTCRLRPKAGKDWNEVLLKGGVLALRKALRGFSAELVFGHEEDEIDVRSAAAVEFAKRGRLDVAVFITELLPLEWRQGVRRQLNV